MSLVFLLVVCKQTHGRDFIKHVLHGGVFHVIPMLHAMNAKHHRQRLRSSSFSSLWIEGFNNRFELIPRHQVIHSSQENLFTCLTTFIVEFAVGKSELM